MDHNTLSKSDTPTAEVGITAKDLQHSGPGIASFIIALVSILGYAGMFVLIIMKASTMVDENAQLLASSSQTIMLLGLSTIILAALNVIGVVSGIIGLALRNRRKVFGIIGTIINGLILIGFMLLISIFLVSAGTL